MSVVLAEGCNILKDLSASATASVRTTIVRCILGTDMKHHTRLLADLAVVCSVDDFASVADGRQLLLTMIIHGSDLGNLAAPREVALKWVDRVCEEFTDQARKSVALGLFVPPHIINLEEEVMRCRLQMNFLDYLVLPLWSTITSILPDARSWLDHLRANREYFGERAALLSARRREPSHAGEAAGDTPVLPSGEEEETDA